MKYKIAMAAIFAMAAAWGAQAQAASDCVDISDDDQRLRCYDMENRPATTQTTVSQWSVNESTSEFDDSKTVSVVLYSSDSIAKRFGGRDSATLALWCTENTTKAYFTFAGNFMADIQGYGRVRYRIDDEAAVTKSMDVSTDNESLGLWYGGSSIPFIKSMFGHDSMVVRVTPFNQSPITMKFPISGLEDAVKPLREACHW
ncbi:type VI secretion system-associated protein TagO [Salinicola sp. JS01]|uniref:type VI secretion system-associated protein TagO n=1 Tax=Salinicola sp. JS01 TaxID=3050071 RepID=UPI00255C1049|nr:type VI secretion system-associated protein TagO [Salinicola sp. JS01]WIX34703.1 type VI secretion system-associated protein TagO [Salinicola sp. JS01]